MTHEHLYLPFKSCACRPFMSCIRCWADETQALEVKAGEVQCKQGHPITSWRWYCIDPVFLLRFINTPKLEQYKHWLAAVLLYSLMGILLFSFLLSNPDSLVCLVSVFAWDVAMALLPVFTWRYSSAWQLIVSPSLWTLTITLNVLASNSKIPSYAWISFSVNSVLAFYIISLAQLYIDHYCWYKCYVDIVEGEIPEIPALEGESGEQVVEEPGNEGQARFSM